MKHIFYIHSHITHMISRQIIKQFSIPTDNCLFLLDRNFSSDFNNSMAFPFSDFPFKKALDLIFPWKQRKKLEKFDNWISQAIADDFHLYIPHSVNIWTHIFLSHPNCKAYSYIEEGKATYLKVKSLSELYPKHPSLFKRILYSWSFGSRVPDERPFYDHKNPKYRNAFTISKSGFPSLRNKVLLEMPFLSDLKDQEYKELIIIGPFVENKRFSLSTYKIVLGKLLDWMIEKDIKKVHLKFHPGQKRLSIDELLEVIDSKSEKIRVIILGDDTVLENIAMSTSCNFYCVLSSAGIYAGLAGNKVYSIAKSVMELEPAFKKVLDNTPSELLNRIIFLENL